MFLSRRIARLAAGATLCGAALLVAWFLPKTPDAFAPFVPQAPPQLALGDFDGDGRVDAAIIHDRSGERGISLQLSASTSTVDLEVPVKGVIERDIDHDGDLDLVAATLSGDVVIWLNDGHGRFTRQDASRTRSPSNEPVIIPTVWSGLLAIGLKVPLPPSHDRGAPVVIVAHVRGSTVSIARAIRCSTLPALRAPPVLLA
jgi:hypothetical protein